MFENNHKASVCIFGATEVNESNKLGIWKKYGDVSRFRFHVTISHKGDLRPQEALTDLDIKKKKVRGGCQILA